jgi:pyruvate/2-oxoglutarate dehydrogenase complex dihydrolipoamide dehydrogenase (E3) component
MKEFDAIIIGAGQAGPSLAAKLVNAGMKVAIVERHLFGGTCVNTGCMPTKAMVASARSAYMARRAADYGVGIDGSVTVDMKKVIERKNDIVGRKNHEAPQWMTEMKNLTVFKGHAMFEDSQTVNVGEQKLRAKKIFINVGGRAFVPPMPGLKNVPYLTNSNIMKMDSLPEHLVVIGGSYIGLEFGQMYRRFGSEVTIVQRGPRLIPREDEDVSETVKDILENEGINIRLNADCVDVEKRGDKVVAKIDCNNPSKEVVGSHLLLAVGRVPNTHDLCLEKAGVKINQNGYIMVDNQLRTNIPGIWALGDCNGQGAFTHTSYNDYEIVAANLLEGDSRGVSDRIPAYGLFTDPPFGRAGLTEAQVRASGIKALVSKLPMARVGRAVERGETQGFMKILIDAETSEILGAAFLGINGDEAVHSVLDIMYAKVPYTVIQKAIHIHPTVSELIPTMLNTLKPFN